MEIIEKQVEKVKEVPADNYGYNYGRRDINGKANAGLTLGINYTDRKTCKAIYGEVCLPNTPVVTGYGSGRNSIPCERQD